MNDLNENNSNNLPKVFVRFLVNDDTITISGECIEHVFYETMVRYPDKFPSVVIDFSGVDYDDSQRNAGIFFDLARMYGNI
jgi:anti-anti-sigma regulatory factor